MKTKKILIIASIALVVIAAGVLIFLKTSIGSIVIPPKSEVKEIDPLIAGLTVPEGFTMSVYAKNVPDARVILFDSKGRMLVSQTDKGQISVFEDTDANGSAEKARLLAGGMKNPHGMVFKCTDICQLYVAESNSLTRFDYDLETGTVSNKTKLSSIAYSVTDNHVTRTLMLLSDNILLVSVGSSCNVCNETNYQHAKILAFDLKTNTFSEYAKGLRNSVFMAKNPIDGKIYATEMGRDGLGDNIPPDELNIIEGGKNYGWPICYANNIHDDNFDKNTYIRNPCSEPFETPSFVNLQAHSAPLGLAFAPWAGFENDILVAMHGSWNRSVPTGYKIVRVKTDGQGLYLGTEDFVTGWLTADGEKTGRPVDLVVGPDKALYISDDSAGLIYRLSKN